MIIAGAVLAGIIAGIIPVMIFFRSKLKNTVENSSLRHSGEISVLNEKINFLQKENKAFACRAETTGTDLKRLNNEKIELLSRLSALEARNEDEKTHHADKMKILEDSKNKLSDAFRNLANRIFEENSEKMTKLNKESIENIISPLNEKLVSFRKKVEETHEKNIRERSALIEKITSLQELNVKLSKEAGNLTNALKGNVKKQGNWGEMILETILEASGLRNGWEYETQKNISDGTGGRSVPDVVVKLPDGKCVIIDSKVSLNAYEKFCSAESEQAGKNFLKEHIASIKRHIDNLSSKNYQDLHGIKTLDFVLLFVPVESAFAAAVNEESRLFTEAISRNIVVVTPSTLLATLRTITHIWKQEYQNRNSAEIARRAGDMYDKFNNFLVDLEAVGQRLSQAEDSYQGALKKLSAGRGNLIKRAEDIRKLGIKVKSEIPARITRDAIEDNRSTPEIENKNDEI